MEYKLNFELVPDGCWYSNLRSILSKAQWEFIRNEARERAGGRCMVCGKKSSSLEAHERWSYDEKNGIQKLEDVVAVCKDCHSVMHIGHTQLKKGNIEVKSVKDVDTLMRLTCFLDGYALDGEDMIIGETVQDQSAGDAKEQTININSTFSIKR